MPHSPGIKRGPGPSYLQEQQPPKAPADAFNTPAAAAPLPDHLRGEGVGRESSDRSSSRRGRKTRLELLEVWGFIPASFLIIPNSLISLGTAVPHKANPVLLEATPLHVPILGGDTSVTAQLCT